MRILRTLAVLGTIGLATMSPAIAEGEYTKGMVKKVDADSGKVTIFHEELKNLDMPPMTMVFRVADPEMLETMSEGAEIMFIAERINGKLTVVDLK